MSLDRIGSADGRQEQNGLEAFRAARKLQETVIREVKKLGLDDARRDEILHAEPEGRETILEAQNRVAQKPMSRVGHHKKVHQLASR